MLFKNFWQQLCFRWFPPHTENTHEPLRHDCLRRPKKGLGTRQEKNWNSIYFRPFRSDCWWKNLLQVVTETVEPEEHKFNPTSSFVSEWMFSPDVVFFHGITEVFSYFQDNYFSAKDEYGKARNTVLVLLYKSLNRGQFFLIFFLRKKYTSVLAQLRKN